MRFEVLGPVRALDGDGAAVPLPPRMRALLAVLIAAAGHPVSAERLIAELWPGEVPPTAAGALQVHVSGLRKIVGAVLETTPGGYRLRAPSDADEFTARVAGDALDEALALWRGPAFEGGGSGPIVAAASARLTEALLAARLRWADRELAAARPVVAELSGWVAAEPVAEPLVERLMLALYRAGRAGAALELYERTVLALADYGTTPRPAPTALAEAIRRGDPTLDRPAPGLPGSRNRFIGRRAELDRVIDLLGGARLLTVTGPGGCGKTRLSVELAREITSEYETVHIVELAGLTTELLAERVAAATGAREEQGVPVLDVLARHLAGRTLLVLDNCEHVRAAAARFVHDLLPAVPGIRVVATSREPLGLAGEVVFSLEGLGTPDAVRLFTDRVTAARGGAGLQPGEAPVVAELCRRLDGLPLAIELAAARLRALALSEIMVRLDRRLELLVGTSPVPRHQTMRAAIDWGFDLLDAGQQQLLVRLGVFAGSFDLAAASAVAGADALNPLTRLVERSMVERRHGRYALIETLREYALDRLAEDDPARERHVALRVGQLAVAPPTDGPAHTRWLATTADDYDNIQAALTWSLEHGQAEQGLRIAAGMWWYWWVTGRMAEGRSWLGRALEAVPADPTPLRGQALRAAASLARNSGDLPAARELGEQALAVFRELADGPGAIAALNNLSITAQAQHDYEASLAFGYEGLALAEKAGAVRAIAATLNNTAGTLRCQDRLDEAEPLFERALARFREVGEQRGEAAALTNLGIVTRRRGRLGESGDYMRRALRIYADLGIAEGQLDALEGLAQLSILAGDPLPGLTLLAVADRERADLGSPIFTPDEIADREDAEHRARNALTPDGVAQAFRTASATSLEAAVQQLTV
ncbi:tetratricopeptide repeat protein [Paractinoplanes maris]|uniref:tetratricopeptide repeat protein n=1 Tax=Paractinoplanes maris TaxID=1734446 RepID=UPI0020206695|nr:tetratricopeptide repeat protein [Actinoplanes maris]